MRALLDSDGSVAVLIDDRWGDKKAGLGDYAIGGGQCRPMWRSGRVGVAEIVDHRTRT